MNKYIPIASLLVSHSLSQPKLVGNYMKAAVTAARKPEVVKSLPISLHIEPTTACNLRCTTCDRTYAKDLNLGTMSFEDFKKILDQFDFLLGSHGVQTGLLMTGLGEPLLNKEVFRMIEYAKQQGITYVHTISNGTVMTDRVIDRLTSCGLDHISFSMDGATREIFEKIRVGAKYDKVVRSLKKLSARRPDKSSPVIDLNITLQKENSFELPKVVELAVEIGVDRVSARIFNPDFARNEISAFEIGKQDIESASELAKSKGVKFRYANDDTDPCVYPWIWPYITWNGYVVPCCYRSDPRQFNFGNVLEDPFEQIWNGKKYRNFRKELISENPPSLCKHCPKCPGGR